jgi:TolB-like protein
VWGAEVRAATPTVAVMPFRDLSGGKGSVGEAIRETVTADLKDVTGLRVIERGEIDQVLVEQKLQATRVEMDPSSTVRVGKLLGATLIVTGAYQRAASSVRLTARFVRVETGEVVGTAKVDGAAADFLTLQDRVTAELLRSGGFAPAQVSRFVARPRKPVKSWKTIELYGDAVAEPDEEKRVPLLQAALNEDPSFEYAARDLDALEARLRAYDRKERAAEQAKLEELRKQAAVERDPRLRAQLEAQVLSGLSAARRWHGLRVEARAQLARKPTNDLAAFQLVLAAFSLKEWDGALHEGEAFLARFAGSPYFKSVTGLMDQAIQRKRRVEAGRDAVAAELAQITGEARWDLCRFGRAYRNHEQHPEAQRFLRACLEAGAHDPKEALRSLIQEDLECADWARARKDIGELEKLDPAAFRSYKSSYEMQLPADG